MIGQYKASILCPETLQENLPVARDNGSGFICFSPVVQYLQQLGNDVYNYKTLLDYQVNEYVYVDGTKPFGKAPDSQRGVVVLAYT